jgi:hypothetical protein
MPSCGVSPASMKPVISAKHAARPGGIARQQDLARSVFDHRGQHRRRVVPVREAAGRAAQALLFAAVFLPRQHSSGVAQGAEAEIVAMRVICFCFDSCSRQSPRWEGSFLLKDQAGNTPVDR